MIFTTVEELVREATECRREGLIIWTSGCFDLFHAGHASSLSQALKAGMELHDFLFVGINSDASVRSNKGSYRPIIPQDQRCAIVDTMHCVWGTIIFDDPTPCTIISELKPDVFVKGADWKDKDFPERAIVEAYGGRVEFVPLLEGVSTTGIIERIQRQYLQDCRETRMEAEQQL